MGQKGSTAGKTSKEHELHDCAEVAGKEMWLRREHWEEYVK